MYKISILLKKFRNWIALISTHLLGQLLISSVFSFSRFTFEMEVTNRRCQTNPPPPKKEKKNRSSPLTTNGTTTAVRTTAPIRHNARLLHVIRFRKRENTGSRHIVTLSMNETSDLRLAQRSYVLKEANS